MTIPVSVIITTLNEAKRLPACLAALKDFGEVIVIDSKSRDQTQSIAQAAGAGVIEFSWNQLYPKKRQWTLDNVSLKHEWVFFVDADEIATPELCNELRALFAGGKPACHGYFIKGYFTASGKPLKYGLINRKLALFRRDAFKFPVVDDLDIPGMGEIEGHYQPVPTAAAIKIGALQHGVLHDALDDVRGWNFRHEKYARWEAGMLLRHAWPTDPVPWRQKLKTMLRQSRFRPELMFVLSYIILGGFLDGVAGLELARRKRAYYQLIRKLTAAY